MYGLKRAYFLLDLHVTQRRLTFPGREVIETTLLSAQEVSPYMGSICTLIWDPAYMGPIEPLIWYPSIPLYEGPIYPLVWDPLYGTHLAPYMGPI